MKIKFDQEKGKAFKKELHQKVNQYFTEKGISKHYNSRMIWKTVAMLLLYLIPYALILTNMFPLWANYLLFVMMGVGTSGIGMSVMHDANHAGYAKSSRVNNLMGLTMNLIGSDAYNWKIKHNKLHHVFTNIYKKDEDIDSRVVLRFAYASPLKKYHRFQHIYVWFFYLLMSLSLVFADFAKRIRYRKKGITSLPLRKYRVQIFWLIISKILYFSYIIAIPVIFTSMNFWQVFTGFLLLHFTAGLILSVIFQMAHVLEGPTQSLPDENGKIDDSLIIMQMRSTADFSKNNWFITWFVGGLNFQVVHHLFPKICHVHYPAIARILEDVASRHNVPYYVYDTFGQAFNAHVRTLKKLGKYDYQSYLNMRPEEEKSFRSA